MLSLAAALLAIASVASASARDPGRADRAAALACAAAALIASVRENGIGCGLLVAAVLAMTAASALVLITAPRPAFARPLALASAVAGGLCLLGGLS